MRLPEFCIAGAQKSGTSTLYVCLCSHDDVHAPVSPDTGDYIKEVNFFGNNWDKGLDWYRAHFKKEGGVYLDSTPNYLCDIRAHQRMKDVIPDAKLIISLRDPVARAYSQFNHYSQCIEDSKNWDFLRPGESFMDNILAELQEPRRSWYGMLSRGYYVEQLTHLFQFFPRDQVHVVIMERWIQNPDECLSGILDFLELPQQELKKKAAHMRTYTVDPLTGETEDLLRSVFAPYNERLFELLGESVDEWA